MEKTQIDLIIQAKKGDKESLYQILQKYQLLIKKLSRELNYPEGETDITIWLIELIKKIEISNLTIKTDGAITNYIYKSLQNRKIDLIKKYKTRVKEEYDICIEIFPDPKSSHCYNDIELNTLLNQLPSLQRKIIIQKYIYGYTDSEIAKTLDVSRQSINRVKNRGLNNLKNLINK